MAIHEICPTCTRPGTHICTGCRDIKYCSLECQETDRLAHKLLCGKFRELAERPGDHMRRVRFFPDEGTKPVLLWKEVLDYENPYGNLLCKKPKMVEEMGTEHPRFDIITRNALTGVPLNYEVHLTYDDEFVRRYTTNNRAVINATSNRAGQPWRGPILAFCGYINPEALEKDVVNVVDIGMKEYSYVVAYLIDAYNQTHSNAMLKGPKVRAVKVRCDGDMENGHQRFEAVTVPRLHPQLQAFGDISQISQRIGMPLVYTKCKTAQALNHSNRPVAVMQTCVDPKQKFEGKPSKASFGWSSLYWDVGIGTVLVFSEHYRPLTVDTLEGFSAYCENVLGFIKRTEEGNEKVLEPLTREEALAEITAEKWAKFQATKRDKAAA